MTGNRGNRRGRFNKNDKYGNKASVGEKGREILKIIDENNDIIKAFRIYALEIDEKHDRYERIVKISRDITIESKRIIFLLHNHDKENKRESILKEAELRLTSLINNQFKNIALELENQDLFQYLRAYTNGLQEFVEAFTFLQYLKNNNIEHWSKLENEFIYTVRADSNNSTSPSTEESQTIVALKEVKTPLPAVDFFLGVADLSGELMRKCINNLGSGNIDDCFSTCNFVREMCKGFLSIGSLQGYKEIGRKTYVLKQSLNKMELVCYNIVVRVSEIPKHMLASVISANSTEINHEEQDEGFF